MGAALTVEISGTSDMNWLEGTLGSTQLLLAQVPYLASLQVLSLRTSMVYMVLLDGGGASYDYP